MESSFLDELVANPGAEHVRRAYAEWLATQGDLRSDYLLAELNWNRTRHEADEGKVRRLARSFDPVWVARVSRPPLGVCADHVRFGGSRPRLEARHLDWIEMRFQLRLPADYRAFLLMCNGGCPDPGHFRVPGRAYDESQYDLLGMFLPVLYPDEMENDNDGDLIFRLQFLEEVRGNEADFGDESHRWRGHPHGDLMVIGYSSPYNELSWLCMGCRGEELGRIYYVAPWLLEPTSPDCCFVAPTFAAFIGLLTDGTAGEK
jgi:hypothetical protein